MNRACTLLFLGAVLCLDRAVFSFLLEVPISFPIVDSFLTSWDLGAAACYFFTALFMGIDMVVLTHLSSGLR